MVSVEPAKRLKILREKLGLSQTKFAEEIGIAQTTLSSIERGTIKLTGSNAINIEYIFGANSKWLLTGEGDMMLKKDYGIPLDYNQISNNAENTNTQISGFVNIPYYDIYVSAGMGENIEYEKLKRFQPFSQSWIENTLALNPSKLGIVTANGDSMEPTISNRDMLLVHVHPQYRADGIYVIRRDSFVFVKRLQYHNHGFRIISDNDAYQEEYVDQSNGHDFAIIGRVVWVGKMI